MKNKRVLLGMSGGVDSFAAAIILKLQGYEVIGCTFNFYKENDSKIEKREIKELSKQLQIEQYFIDIEKEFTNTVVEYFINSYLSGETPFPCARCNPELKWKNLIRYAKIFNCSFISTGHYVQIKKFAGKKYIFKGVDHDKDQSFFLWGLNGRQLEKMIFPLGKMNKSEVREFVSEYGFKNLAGKKDSLGVCFIQGNDYRNFLSNELKKKDREIMPGNFVDDNGSVVGQHKGFPFYTIGQRRGLDIQLNEPVFVSEINPQRNEVVLSRHSNLFRNIILIRDYHFINLKEIDSSKIWNLKIRYRNQDTPCSIKIKSDKEAVVNLSEPLESIAPGQTTVFYDGPRVVGGGFIKKTF